MKDHIKRRKRPIESLLSKGYDTIIRINVPMTFYWTHDGFDKIEVGPIRKSLSEQEQLLIWKVLKDVGYKPIEDEIDVPDIFKEAFGE